MKLTAQAIESGLSGAFGLSAKAALAREPADAHALSAEERAAFACLKAEARRQTWLLGRAALKAVLVRCGESDDTASIFFPNPKYSLAHTRGLAVAVGVRVPAVPGIGIDIELSAREPQPRALKFYLAESERAWVAALPEDRRRAESLRLWTVKEALFKANPDNASTTVGEYRVDDPAQAQGRARIVMDSGVWLFRYAGFVFDEAIVSVAVAEGAARCANP